MEVKLSGTILGRRRQIASGISVTPNSSRIASWAQLTECELIPSDPADLHTLVYWVAVPATTREVIDYFNDSPPREATLDIALVL